MEASAGLTLRIVGGEGMFTGKKRLAEEIADCTSWAAASILRSSRNWSVIWLVPWTLTELMESRPGIRVNCVSKGDATEAAMVSASAPGNPPWTTIVGKSTWGSSLTGSEK